MSASDKMGKPIRAGDTDESRPYRCYACSLCFARRSSLVWHNTMHVQEADETDQNMSASDKDGMPIGPCATVKKGRTKNRQYQCSACNLSFARRSSLVWHKTSHKSNRYEKYDKIEVKPVSDKISEQKSDHAGKKQIKYDEIKKNIEVKQVSKQSQFDSKKKPYECSERDISFTRNNSSICHKSMHTTNSDEMTTCYTTTKGIESGKIPSNVSPKAERVILNTSKKRGSIIKTCIDTSRKEDKVPDPCIETLLNKESIELSSCTEKSAFNAEYNQSPPSTTSELAPNENFTVSSDYTESDDYMNHTIECELVDPFIEWDEHLWIGENVELFACSDEPVLNEEYNQSHSSTPSSELTENENFSVSRSRKKDNYVGLDQVKRNANNNERNTRRKQVENHAVEKITPGVSKYHKDIIANTICNDLDFNQESNTPDLIEYPVENKDVLVNKEHVNSGTSKSVNISNAFGDTNKQVEASTTEQLEEQSTSENYNELDTSLITEPKEPSSREEHNQPNSEPSLVKEQHNSNTSAENSYVSGNEKSIEFSLSENRKEPQVNEIITEQTSSVLSGNESPKNKNYDCVVHDLIKYRKLLKSLNSDICDKSLSTKDISEKYKILHTNVKHHKIESLNQDEKQSTIIMNQEPNVRGHFGTEEEASMENEVCENPAETGENSNQENDLGHPNENISAVSSRRSIQRDNDTEQQESDWTENKSDLIKQCIQMWDRIGAEQSSDGMNVSREESNDSSLCEELNENSHTEHDNSKSSKYGNINKEMIGTCVTCKPNSLLNENISKEIIIPITHEPNSSNKENISKELVETDISDVPNLSKNENISKELDGTHITNEPNSSMNENISTELVGSHIADEHNLSKNENISKELVRTHITNEPNSSMNENVGKQVFVTRITSEPNSRKNEDAGKELIGTHITSEPDSSKNENISTELVGSDMTDERNLNKNENICKELDETQITNEPNSSMNENISKRFVGTDITSEPHSRKNEDIGKELLETRITNESNSRVNVKISMEIVETNITDEPNSNKNENISKELVATKMTNGPVLNKEYSSEGLVKPLITIEPNSKNDENISKELVETQVVNKPAAANHKYMCLTCKSYFVTDQEVLDHYNFHNNLPPTATKKSLDFSSGVVEKSQDNISHECDICKRIFKTKYGLKAHITLHTGEKPYLCEMCGKTFQNNASLLVHQNGGVKSCSERIRIPNSSMKNLDARNKSTKSKKLKQSVTMKARSVASNSKRPLSNKYSSDFKKREPSSDKDIYGSNNDVSNVRREKPYKCPVCDLRFSRESGLTSHKSIHKVMEREASDVSMEESSEDSMNDKLFHPESDVPDLSETSESNIDEVRNSSDTTKRISYTSKKVNAHHKESDILINADKKRSQEVVLPNDSPFKCVICLKLFVKSNALIRHMKGHFEGKTDCGTELLQCSTCGKAFHNKNKLKEHERVVHADKQKFKHDVRGYGFSRKRRVIQNRLKSTRNSSRLDGVHQDSISGEIKLEENTNLTNAELFYLCTEADGNRCSSKEEKINDGNESSAYNRMNDSNSKQTKYIHCNAGNSLSHNEQCDNAVMLSNDELRKHKKLDEWLINGKFNKTNMAEKQLDTNKDLVKNQGGAEELECPICSNYFFSKDLLKEHFVSHIDMELIDSIRKKTETSDNTCMLNITSPTNSNLYECSYCSKTFLRKGDLNEHIKIHTGESKFKCDICLKYFSKRNNLIRHMMIHTGLKPYMCDFCEKHFAEKHKLKQHKSIHAREKSCKCNVCGERFAKIANLSEHKKTHERLTPHRCDLCEEKFETFHHLFVHKLSHFVKDEKSDTKKRNIKGRQSQKGAARTKYALKIAANKRNKNQLGKKSVAIKKPECTVRHKTESSSRGKDGRFVRKRSDSKKMCRKNTFVKQDVGKKCVAKRKRLWDGSSSYDSEQNQEHIEKKNVRRSKRFCGKRPARYREKDENDIDNVPVRRNKKFREASLAHDSDEAETNIGDEPAERNRKLDREISGVERDSKEDATDIGDELVGRSEIFCDENSTNDSEKQINFVDDIIIKTEIEDVIDTEPAIDGVIDCHCGICFSRWEEWMKHRESGECEMILVKLRELDSI